VNNKYKLESLAFLLIEEAAVRHCGGIRNNLYNKFSSILEVFFHIIPRMKGNGPLRMVPGKIQAKDEDLRKIVQKIKE